MKKILALLLSSTTGLIILLLIILVPVLMILDFFGANITDGYVEDNMEYAEQYKSVVNKNVKNNNGYVSLERILYFYLEDEKLTFDEIYSDNLDKESKKMLPISDVCELSKYKNFDVCKDENILESGQINEEQAKPFAPPIDFTSSSVTSFFMEQRVVFGKDDVHEAWDLANSAQTPVYSTCDGKVESVSFTQSTNVTDTSNGGGNQIKISCEVNDLTYYVWYAHLYPNSAKVSKGQPVTKGQQIASVGTTGYSTGNHLHYQVSLDGKTIDGMSLIDFTYEDDNTFKPNINYPSPSLPSYKNY